MELTVGKPGEDTGAPASDGAYSGPKAVTTAAGVFMGTANIRNQLTEINDNLSEDKGETSGDDEGGILDMLGGIFE